MEPTKTITLREPIKFGDKTYETIDLKEPTAGQIDKAQRITTSPAASNIELIAQVSGLSARVIEKVPATEYNEASEYLAFFINGAPETATS
jgi:hypothetical protein